MGSVIIAISLYCQALNKISVGSVNDTKQCIKRLTVCVVDNDFGSADYRLKNCLKKYRDWEK